MTTERLTGESGDIALRVRELMRRDGRTQNAFAAAIGIDASKLSKSLAGQRRFTSLELALLAEELRVTVDHLVTGATSALAMAARKNAGSDVDLATRVGTRLAELRGIAIELGSPARFDPLDTSGLSGLERDRGFALAHRALLRMKDRGFNPTADDLANEVEQAFGVDVAVRDLGPDFDGLSVSGPGVALIVVAPSVHPARQRFTIAHELGHILFADDQPGLHLDRDVYQDRKDLSEVRANAFAGALLMPETLVRHRAGRRLNVDELAQLALDLAVSPSALQVRMNELGLEANHPGSNLTFEEAAKRRAEQRRYAALVHQAAAARPPGLLAQDLLSAYLAGEATIRGYAEVLGISPDDARSSLHGDGEAPGS